MYADRLVKLSFPTELQFFLFHIQEVMKSRNEPVMAAAAAAEAAPAEPEEVDELIPPKQEIIDPVSSTEEESIPALSSPVPVAVTEEHVEPHQAESVAVTKAEEASVSEEEDVSHSTTEMTPTEPEVVQSSPVDDVRSSAETEVEDISPAADDVIAAADTLTEATAETVMATEEMPSETVKTETIATEDVLVETGLIVDTDITESIATEAMSVEEEVETDIISSEAPTVTDTAAAAAETHVTEELVSETAPSPVAVEELISFENTHSPVLDAPVQAQTVSDLALDPLLDPFGDIPPVLKPVTAPEPEREELTTTLPVKPEDNLEPAAPLRAEPEVLSPAAEGDVAEQEAAPEGTEEMAEDLEAELNEDVSFRVIFRDAWYTLDGCIMKFPYTGLIIYYLKYKPKCLSRT